MLLTKRKADARDELASGTGHAGEKMCRALSRRSHFSNPNGIQRRLAESVDEWPGRRSIRCQNHTVMKHFR